MYFRRLPYYLYIQVYVATFINEIFCKDPATCRRIADGNGERVIPMCSHGTMLSNHNMPSKNVVLEVSASRIEKVPGSCTCIVSLQNVSRNLTVRVYTHGYMDPDQKKCGSFITWYSSPMYKHRQDCNLGSEMMELNTRGFMAVTYTQNAAPYDNNYCIKVSLPSVGSRRGLKVFCLPFVPTEQATTGNSTYLPLNETSGVTPGWRRQDCGATDVPVLVTVIIVALIIIGSVGVHVMLYFRKRKSGEDRKGHNTGDRHHIQFVSTNPLQYESLRKSTLVPAVSNTYEDLKYDEIQARDNDDSIETKAKDDASSSIADKSSNGIHHAFPKARLAYENMACDQIPSQGHVALDRSYSDAYLEPSPKSVVMRSDSSYISPVADRP